MSVGPMIDWGLAWAILGGFTAIVVLGVVAYIAVSRTLRLCRRARLHEQWRNSANNRNVT